MGLCRGLSLYAGGVTAYITVFPRTTGLLVATGITILYFAAVTNLARHETRKAAPLIARLLPLVVALFGLLLLYWGTSGSGLLFTSPMTACFAAGFLLVAKETVALFRDSSSPLAPRIGAFIRLWLGFPGCLLHGRIDLASSLDQCHHPAGTLSGKRGGLKEVLRQLAFRGARAIAR
jgi:hypothetical protein